MSGDRAEREAAHKRREALGKALRLVRVERGLRQYELARRALFDRTYIAKFESGLREPSDDDLDALAVELGVTVELIRKLAATIEAGPIPWERLAA